MNELPQHHKRFGLTGLKDRLLSFFGDNFFSDRLNRYPLAAAAFINIILWLAILIKIQAQDKPLPLHFNAFYGIEFVGSGFLFLNIPLAGLVLLIINVILARKLMPTQKLLSQTLSFSTLLVEIFLFVGALAIFALNV